VAVGGLVAGTVGGDVRGFVGTLFYAVKNILLKYRNEMEV
jgi:hypothetical protein